jgi:MYXO-CTERM domain-containing protein
VQLAVLLLAAAGCSSEDPPLGVVRSEVTVGSFVNSSCSTSVVIALSQQVAEEVDCLMPGQMVRFEEQDGIQFNGSAVLPYLDAEAREDLYAAAADGGTTLLINSAFRSVVQQYLLRNWFEQGRCGITAAAQPGSSNHEGGRALDVDNWEAWVGTLGAHGWSHDIPGDPVHFDHLASPDIRGADVLAFQRLWNRNNPGDTISEDGDYGPQTAARISASPAEGFPIGATCMAPEDRALDVVDVEGPDVIAPGERGTFTVNLRNTGTVAWTADAVLATSTGAPSVLVDPATWLNEVAVIKVGHIVLPGDAATLVFDVLGPEVDVATPVAERFALVDGDARFGAVPIAVTVDPDDDPTVPGTGDGSGDGTGGCSTGGGGGGAGGSGWLALALAGLLLRRRVRLCSTHDA